VRWNSTAAAADLPPGYIPAPPVPPSPSDLTALGGGEDIVYQLTALGEPTLQSLGLASWWPNGLVQSALEAVHVGLNVPWWASIVITTLGLRILMFPLVVLAQRNSANMHNHMPIVQAHQEKFTRARVSGNPMEAARAGNEYMQYMKTHKINPVRSMAFPFMQVPVFLSVFIGIRQMANLPVESMTTGGALWFSDLTISDPFYALPVLTCATFFATVELGVDGVRAASLSTTARTVMRLLPVIMFPFILNFPTAMLCYWLTSNVISLFQVLFLRIASVRTFCKIPPLVKHDPALLAKQKKPFLKNIKESYKSSKTVVSMEDRLRDEAVKFKQAGLGAVQKTYTHDPTKTSANQITSNMSQSTKTSSNQIASNSSTQSAVSASSKQLK